MFQIEPIRQEAPYMRQTARIKKLHVNIWYVGSHIKIIITVKNFNSKRCGIPQKNTMKVPNVETSLHHSCYLSCV